MYREIYEPDYDQTDSRDDTIHECKEIVKDIVTALYNKDKLDMGDLESNFEELCHVLSIRMPNGDLQIEKKKQPVPAFLADWVDFNSCYLQSIAK